ncbi:MAG: PSD1 and planctomycete cytochrome C domain-containing protein [Verrucomicrobiota bacterium]
MKLVIASFAGILPVVVFSAKAAEKVDFLREVQPILAEHCTHCHGSDNESRKGKLRIDDRDAALKGGKNDGPAIVPGKPDASAMITRILAKDPDEIMPPPKEKKPLTQAQIDTLKRWIADGAEYAKHWAFETPVKPDIQSGTQPVDALVQAKLQALKIQPSPRADAATLCRRIHLDLVGLPPTPQEVKAFEEACQKDFQSAIAACVDRLLKSPHFGEKWARHWLDAARYSDSNGYEKDLPRDQWAWRDWVISSLNADLPYDRFLTEQLAGDLLPSATQDQLVATGFLRNSMTNEEGAIVPEQFRMDEMFDRMDCIGKATLGLSMQCAQCHTHKFDPISQEEYYGIFAYFNNTYEAQSWVYTPAQHKQIQAIAEAISKSETQLKTLHPNWQQELQAWEQSVLEKELPWTPLKAIEMESTSGLNHPTQGEDLSILTLGHPSTKVDIYAIFEPALTGVTGLRLEALTHGDLPFNGPGRSKYGTWAISEMIVTYQLPNTDKWEPLKLVNATADFSEAASPLEDEWKASFDKEHKRTRGPVEYMIDGNLDTGWRADRGLGQRNQESVAVVQFEKPLDLPVGTKLKVLLEYHHSGDDNGRHNTMLGRYRISTTTAPEPKAQPVDYAAVYALQTAPEKRTSKQNESVFTAWRKTVKEAKDINAAINAEWKKYPAAQTSVLHLADRTSSDTRETHLLDRGGWDKPKQTVAAHPLQTLNPYDPSQKQDRLAFAKWLTDKRAPLTARVAVNRIWQAIFGSGLCETAEDFGTRAAIPEHRELLDYLAVDLMEHGWSQKHIIRTILTSATYQQSSKVTPEQRERDPRNRFLARGPRFRMEAEVIRDNALSVAGLLHSQIGGPSIFPPVPQSVLDFNYFKPTYWTPSEGPERYRRSLYVFRKRSMPDPVMSSFDAPNGDLACARRPRSNTPLSALTGLNETTFVEAAQAFAQRVLKEGGSDDQSRADYAYQLCMARNIKPAEAAALIKLLEESRARLLKGELHAGKIAFSSLTKAENLPANATPNEIAAWTIVGRVLLNLDETLTKS